MTTRPVIAGIGEVLWDVYPEAAHFGGAPANAACHAASLGVEAWMVSAVGSDTLGNRALTALQERGVSTEGVVRMPANATGQVLVTLNAKGQARYDFAADTAWDQLPWTTTSAALAPRCDAVCFGTLGQRAPTARATIRRFVAATPREAYRVFDVNLRQLFFDREIIEASLQLANVVKLNDEELPVVAGLCGLGSGAPADLLRAMVRRYDLRLAALTRGPGGALLVTDLAQDECLAPLMDAVDTVGAGDAFTATLMIGMLRGLPLGAINRQANAIAAYVCSQSGATPPLPPELCVWP